MTRVRWRRLAAGGLVAALAVAACTPVLAGAAPSSGTTGDWTLIGGTQVSAMARSGDVVYLGGSFTGIARRAPGVAAFDTTTGQVASTAADLDAPAVATAVAAAPDGGVYVAGPFPGAGGVAQPRLLHFTSDDKLDRSFRPDLPGATIEDIEVGPDGTVYVAGTFGTVGGQVRNGLAALDGTTGAVRPWQPDLAPGSTVHEIALGAGGLFLTGSFVKVGTQPRAGLAQISLANAAPTAWNPGPTGGVSSLAVAGSTVFVGGSFTQMGGVVRHGLAAVSTSGSGALLPWNPSPDGSVTEVRVHGSTVYASGTFGTVGGQARHRLAALDAVTGDATSWDAGIATDDPPTAIVPTDDRVYLGFATPPGRKVSIAGALRCGLAVVDAGSGQVDPSWDPQLSDGAARCGGGTDGVRSLALVGGRLWAGGRFEVANVRPRSGLAAINVVADQPTDWAPAVDVPSTSGQSGVRDLLLSPDGATVFLAGQFSNVDGVPRANAAAVSASGSASDPTDVTDWNPAPNGRVNALAFSPSGQRVYLGGEFTALSGTSRPRLTWVSPTTGARSAWAPAPDGKVSDLAVAPDGTVFAAGAFAHAGAQAPQPERHGLAAFTPDTADATAWDPAGPADAAFDSLALSGGLVYAAGKLSGAIGGQPHVGVVALDQVTATATTWDPHVAGRSSRVQRVTPAPDGTVYLMGDFSSVGGVARNSAASVTAAGTVTGWNPPALSPGSAPPSLQFAGDRIVAGGAFTNAGGRTQAGFAIFGPATAPEGSVLPVVRYASPLRVGLQLTCQPGSYTGSGPFTLAYEWLRDGQPITGETGITYTTTLEDAAHQLSCREHAANAAGDAQQDSVAVAVTPEPPVLAVAPAVGGEAWVGGAARCSTGLWRNAPAAYAYRWLLDGTVVAGATDRDLPLADVDLGRSLVCEVTAQNAAGMDVALSAAVIVGVAPPLNLASPLLTGAPRVGTELGCDAGSWARASDYVFGWLRDGVTIPGASGPRLQLTSRDLGRAIACRVTASGPGGMRSADSAEVRVQAPPHSLGTQPQEPAGSAAQRSRPLDLRQARVGSDGVLVLKVAVPGASVVSVEATWTGRTHASDTRGAARVLIGRTTAHPRRAGIVTLRLRPSSAARRALRRAGRHGLQVQLVVRLRPAAGGTQRTARTTITMRAVAARTR